MLKDQLKRRAGPLWPAITLIVGFAVRVMRVARGRSAGLARRCRDFLLRVGRRAASLWRRLYTTVLWFGELFEFLSPDLDDGALTVAVDTNPFWEQLTGVGWYLHRLLIELQNEDGLVLRLYGPNLFLDRNDPRPVVELPAGSAIEQVGIEVPEELILPHGLLIRALRKLHPLVVAARRERVLFAPNFVLPDKFRFAQGALVVTVHDLALRRFSWTLREETLSVLRRELHRNLRRAREVITVSTTVREELLSEGEVTADQVTAIHHGPGHLSLERQSTKEGAALPAAVPERFALHVGTIEPRKNIATLIAAWRRLVDEDKDSPALLLCGGGGWKSDALHRDLERAEAEGWLVRLGYVDDPALAALYAHATMVACPSLYEGFGLPLVEALAAGVPVVCSDIPVFREVAGDAALFVEAEDIQTWVTQIRRLLVDRALRQRLSERAVERAADFDWRRAALSTLAVWRRAESRRSMY